MEYDAPAGSLAVPVSVVPLSTDTTAPAGHVSPPARDNGGGETMSDEHKTLISSESPLLRKLRKFSRFSVSTLLICFNGADILQTVTGTKTPPTRPGDGAMKGREQ